MAGEWGEAGSGIELLAIDPREVLERVARPESLAGDRDAYALTVVGDSMNRITSSLMLVWRSSSAIAGAGASTSSITKCALRFLAIL